MPQICNKCQRPNPPDAIYCHYDGVLLAGHLPDQKLPPGQRPFPTPFVFPSGQTCQNFDQLALACMTYWEEARQLLQQGHFAHFLGLIGRLDLALAAQEAARFPDADRGLDQFLTRLPTTALEPPKLGIEPTEINLGEVSRDAPPSFELHLSNLGGRIIYGSITTDVDWLVLGDPPGVARKLFQFRDESRLRVQVQGDKLRAGHKPCQGQLLLDSNAGPAKVLVQVRVPVKPFPDGVLAGATSPRDIALKAKEFPKEAAVFFENGSVARWYQDNGWTYPVQGQAASGIAAIQQFYEALGLVKPPKVEVTRSAIHWEGRAGEALQDRLEVRTQERRPIWAWGNSDQPWLEVGRAKLNGRVATLPLKVPRIPNYPGTTLQATLVVTANGNQRFQIPVSLSIQPGELQPLTPLQGEEVQEPPIVSSSGPQPRAASPKFSLHFLPLLFLFVILLGILLRDFLIAPPGRGAPVDPRPRLALEFDWGEQSNKSLSFGLMVRNPRSRSGLNERLTFSEKGTTNNLMVRIDGQDFLFGKRSGKWETKPHTVGRWGGKEATWLFDQRIAVTQRAELFPGEPQIVEGEYKSLVDTCLVRYTIVNQDRRPHRVGLRFLLDTYIGNNDGVPFTIPGKAELIDTQADLRGAEVPDFLQVLEKPDLHNPGTVAQLTLRLGKRLESPQRVCLTRYPGLPLAEQYEIPLQNFALRTKKLHEEGDSAVVLYWEEKELVPRQKREVGFAYGLGSINADQSLALAVGGALVAHQEFTVLGLLRTSLPDQSLTLELPKGLEFVGCSATQKIDALPVARPAVVTWRVRAQRAGTYVLRLRWQDHHQERRIVVLSRPLF
jgi:hypothetical protein